MHTELRIRRSGATFALAASLLLGACASEPPPRPARLDPANPAAAESPPLAVRSLTGGGPTLEATPPSAKAAEPPAAAAAPGGHQHGAAPPSETGAEERPTGGAEKKATTYTCPMHPEVVSDKPGRCPKCGMNLVPKTEAPPPEGKK